MESYRREVEDFLNGQVVFVPNELADLSSKFRKRAGRETRVLLYFFVDQLFHAKKRGRWGQTEEGVFIHSKRFPKALGCSTATVSKAKDWLRTSNFLEISSGYQEGQYPKWYRPLRGSDYRPYSIEVKRVADVLEMETSNDPASKFTRQNLDLLEFGREDFFSVFHDSLESSPTGEKRENGQFKEEYERIRPTLYPVAKLLHKRGRVFRDKTERLHSPFTTLKSSYRGCFKVDGEHLVGLDMKAAQPTLLSHLSGDEKLLQACLDDQLYSNIGRVFNCDRDAAKEAYCWFAYGNIRTRQTEKNEPVFKVQEMFRNEYQTAAEYMLSRKTADYKAFSLEMMKSESEVFVDGVLMAFRDKDIFCLTVHDCLYFKESDEERATEIAEQTIKEKLSEITGKKPEKIQFKLSRETYSPTKRKSFIQTEPTNLPQSSLYMFLHSDGKSERMRECRP